MARPIEAVKDINDSKDLWNIVVRCKHIWTVTSDSNKEHIELVLFDSKLDLIQAIVPSYLVSKFKEQLSVGKSYIMQYFMVSSNNFNFRSTVHGFKLVFYGSTSIKSVELEDIPVHYLNLLRIDAIVDGKYKPNVLFDIVGGVTEISQTSIIADSTKRKVVITLTDMSKQNVQCCLWGKHVVQFFEYFTNYKDDGNIVLLLINARVKEPQGGYPLNVSNAWSGTQLVINDLNIAEIKNLKEKLQADMPVMSSSMLQLESTQNSQFSEFDKFVCKAYILSLYGIGILQHETTCVVVATLEKFECGQAGWYYDGCAECTKSVSLKDEKLICYSKHVYPEPVPRYKFKLEVLASDDKFKMKLIFWDVDCVKLVGKSALQMKTELLESGEYDPLEFPYELDAILKKELAIRAVYQPNKSRLSVIGFKKDEETRKRIRDGFKNQEHTSKMQTPELSSQDELVFVSEPVFVSTDYDPALENPSLTPNKRSIADAVEDIESVQLSSTKLNKDIKVENI